MGFVTGKVSPGHFYPDKWGVCGLVHGADFVSVGRDGRLNKIARRMSNKFKANVITTGRNDRNELRVLKRRIAWTPQGGEYESGHRRADRLLEEAGVTARPTVLTPAIRVSRKARKGENDVAGADGTIRMQRWATQRGAENNPSCRCWAIQRGPSGVEVERHSEKSDDRGDGCNMVAT